MITQKEYLNQIQNNIESLKEIGINYWLHYSSFNTWPFWINLFMLIFPLIVLYFKIDRRKIFLLGFYGFAVHILFTYIDGIGTNLGYWLYPYKLVPLMPINFMLDVSLVPVAYMLIYQWTLNNKKNYYLYIFILCLFFSFILKPIMVMHNYFQFGKGANYFHLLIGYIICGLFSKWVVNFFFYLHIKRKES